VARRQRTIEGAYSVRFEKSGEPVAHPALTLVGRMIFAYLVQEFVRRAEHEAGVSPMMRGALLAIASAVAFGATTPLIGYFGASLGPWTVAALLYFGAAIATLPAMRSGAIARSEFRRIALTGIIGAMFAPAALTWGIAHTGALSASLVLSLEAIFTVAIAALFFHEHVGRRVVIAALLIAAGAAVLVAAGGNTAVGALGIAAVATATLLWAIDNAITGTITGADPNAVVVLKSATGIAGSVAFALLARETPPGVTAALALAAIGALGFGLSLRWYLLAQRTFGVARTASLFSIAPFAGSAIAFALGERASAGPLFAFATVLIGAGVALHLGERHEHPHRHGSLVHSHPHAPDAEHRHAH
jgi:drug/metabolite transporter (DMT)-like permease